MKITSLSAATLAAALLVGTAYAGFPDEDGRFSRKLQGNGRNNDKKDKGGDKDKNKTPGPPDSRDADGGIDLIIKYKNDNGFNKAKGLASNGKIKGISGKKKLAALRVGREKMKDLRDDPDIEYVEIDYEVTALPHVRGSDAAETSSTGERRLAEEIPWGIAKVNAGPGGLAQGSQKQVKVCVVDTGLYHFTPWGYETSWRVLNAAGIEVSNGGSYDSQTLYEEKMCLADGEYSLELNDTYGDGICCANGYYKLFVGDSLEKHGGAASPDGNFQFQEITPFTVGASAPTATPPTATPVPPTPAPVVPPTPSPTASCETLCCFPIEDGGTGGWANDYMLGICAAQGCHYETGSNGSPYCSGQNYYWTCMQSQCGVDPPTAAPVPPTPAPVVPPTPAPVVPPTAAPVTPCPVTVTVEILTDNYPGETTWTVTDNAGVLKGSGGPYASSGTLYTAEVCVEDENVSFHISDSYGDGICCGYGQGSYKVSVGSRQMQAVGQFAHGEATSFGSACGATSVGASTVGREKKASGEACKAHSDCLGDVCLGSGHCE